MEALVMQLQSIAIVIIMAIGIILRRQRQLHVKLMSTAMVWDLILILQIELSRSAILKASNVTSNTLALNIHVSIAVTTVILYAFMIHSGRQVLNGNNLLRKRHKILGLTTFMMRLLTLITSFWAVTIRI